MRFTTILSLFTAPAIAAPAPAPAPAPSSETSASTTTSAASAADNCGTLTCPERANVIRQLNRLMTDKAAQGNKETDADKKLSEQFILSLFRGQAQTNRKCAVAAKCAKIPKVKKVQDICKVGSDGKYDCKL